MKRREKYAELFAAEAREHLSDMSRALVALEGAPEDRESLDAVFRSVHTIKGMAGAMGYEVAARLAHTIESALDELRAGRRRVAPDVIDLLLESGDVLEAAVEATVRGEEPADPAPVIERLVLWRLEGETAAAAAEVVPTGAGEQVAAEGTRTSASGSTRPRAGVTPARRSDSSRVRVDIRRLDALMNLMGELAIVRGRIRALAQELGSESLAEAVEEAGRLIAEMQVQVVESRMVPVWQVFDRFPRLVRDTARSAGKEVEIRISGKELELDRSLLDSISDPLVHLLRNAVDHGIESPEERERAGKPRVGVVELSARRERARVVIEVSDDGRGIDREAVIARARRGGLLGESQEPTDQELFKIMARPGFTTSAEVTTLSGRGVGLNVVEDTVRALGGAVELRSERGSGTSFRLELPLTLVILPALIVEVGEQFYALPATFTRESFEAAERDVERAHGREWIRWRDGLIPLTRMQRLFAVGTRAGGGMQRDGANGSGDGVLKLVALEFAGERLAICVDRFVGEEEIVVKSFHPPLGAVPVFAGATVRPDGKPALVIDVGSLS